MIRLFPRGHTGPLELSVRRASQLVRAYPSLARQGPDYYDPPAGVAERTGLDEVGFHDLAWAVLLAAPPRRGEAAQGFFREGSVDISGVASRPLHTLTCSSDRAEIVEAISRLDSNTYPQIRVSTATKMIHPKRPATVPVLDRKFFRTYMNTEWRVCEPVPDSARASSIAAAVEHVYAIVADGESQTGWERLEQQKWWERDATFERIELFDMIWWALVHRPDLLPELC